MFDQSKSWWSSFFKKKNSSVPISQREIVISFILVKFHMKFHMGYLNTGLYYYWSHSSLYILYLIEHLYLLICLMLYLGLLLLLTSACRKRRKVEVIFKKLIFFTLSGRISGMLEILLPIIQRTPFETTSRNRKPKVNLSKQTLNAPLCGDVQLRWCAITYNAGLLYVYRVLLHIQLRHPKRILRQIIW